MSEEEKKEEENKESEKQESENRENEKHELEKHDTELLGKKIFFLYPTASVQSQIVTELVQNEYEAYTIKNHTRFLKIIKKYPDSIIFANIDDGMKAQEWERYIGAFHSAMPDVKIGVFSSSNDEDLKTRYIEKHKISCGFMNLKVDMTKTTPVILEILNKLNAKGRRKYLRASTINDPAVMLNVSFNSNYIKGSIRDISVVGIACIFENDPGFKKNEMIKDIQIKLGSMLLRVEGVVFGCRDENSAQGSHEGSQKIYVLIFTQRIDPDVRVKIRKYIQGNLQNKIDTEPVS